MSTTTQPTKMSSKALKAYSLYRDLGPQRSLAEVAKRLGKSRALIERWSALFNWGKLVSLHDQHVSDQAARAEQQVRIAESLQRRQERLDIASEQRTIGLDTIKYLHEQHRISAAAAALIRDANEIERRDLGELDQRIEVGGNQTQPIRISLDLDTGRTRFGRAFAGVFDNLDDVDG